MELHERNLRTYNDVQKYDNFKDKYALDFVCRLLSGVIVGYSIHFVYQHCSTRAQIKS